MSKNLDDSSQVTKATVMVVDDAPENITLLTTILQDSYRIKVANNAEKALKILASNVLPDIILLDIMMPDIDGYELCERIKSQENTKDIPIVFITGKDDIEDEKKGFDLGAVDYIKKPISPPIVRARVKNHLELNRLFRLEQESREQAEADRERIYVEQLKTENLMLNILPKPIAERLKRNEKNISGDYPETTILFADIVGFSQLSRTLKANQIVAFLNALISIYDGIANELGVEKIKTIGDCYMAAAGVPIPRADHAHLCARMALRMIEETENFSHQHASKLSIRVGIASGPVVAGVIGDSKFLYDLWGNTVNLASRMESTSEAGKIQVAEDTYKLLQNEFNFEAKAEVECKGIGKVQTYYLLKEK